MRNKSFGRTGLAVTVLLLWSGLARAGDIPALTIDATLALPRIDASIKPLEGATLADPGEPWSGKIDVNRVGENWEFLDAKSRRKLWQIAKEDMINQLAGRSPSYAHVAGDRWVHLDGHYETPRVRLIVINLKKQQMEWEAFLGESSAAEYLVAQNLSRDGKIYGVAHIRDRRKKTGKGYVTTVRFLDLENKRRLSDAEFTHQPDYGLGARELISLAGDRFAIMLWRDLVFWDARAGKMLARFEGVRRDSGPIRQDHAVSQDGSKLALVAVMEDAAGIAHLRAQVYAADGRLLKLLRLPGDSPLRGAARYCENDRYVVLTGEIEKKPKDVPVTAVWDLAANKLLTFGSETLLPGVFAGISADCSRLAYRPAEKQLTTISLPSGKVLSELGGQDYHRVSPDVSWSFQERGGVLTLHSLLTGHAVHHLRLESDSEMRWSADSRALEYLVFRNGGTFAQRVALTLPERPDQASPAAQVPPGHAHELRFSADGRSLMARYDHGAARWNLESRRADKAKLDYDLHAGSDYEYLPPSPHGWLAVHRQQDQGVVMDMLTGQRFTPEPAGPRHNLTSVQDMLALQRIAMDADSGEYFLLGKDSVARYRADGTRIQTITVPPPAARLIATRGGRLALVADDRSVRVLEPAKDSPGTAVEYTTRYRTTLPPARFQSSCLFLYRATLSPNGRYLQLEAPLCTQAPGPKHAVYDLATGVVVGPGDLVSPFSARHARYVILGASGEALQVWDPEQKKVTVNLSLGQRECPVQGCNRRLAVLSEDGRLAAANAGDQMVRVWAVDRQQLLGELRLSAPVTALALSPDNRRLAVATQDERIVLATVPASP